MEALGLDTNWLYNPVLNTVVPKAVMIWQRRSLHNSSVIFKIQLWSYSTAQYNHKVKLLQIQCKFVSFYERRLRAPWICLERASSAGQGRSSIASALVKFFWSAKSSSEFLSEAWSYWSRSTEESWRRYGDKSIYHIR